MKRLFLLASALLVTIACERNSYETFTSDYKVFFSCDVSQSPYNQLQTPGRFLSVKKGDGVLNITDSDGKNFQEPLSAIQNGSFIFGLAGLIIGTPTFNNDNSSIWAFDLGCPECNSSATRIKFDLQGNASCSKCGGTWSLNTSGFPTDDKSRPLYRYPTSFNNGILTVSN